MDRNKLKDALEKGHGRALQFTRERGSLLDEEMVLDACLNAWACDTQIEGSRTWYMLNILDAGHALPRLATPILQRIHDNLDWRNEQQRAELVLTFMQRGYPDAKEALRRLSSREDLAYTLCQGITRLAGEEGLLHAAHLLWEARGEELYVQHDIIAAADSVLGDGKAHSVLRQAANSPRIRAMLTHAEKQKAEIADQAERSKQDADDRPVSVTEFITGIRRSNRLHYPRWLRDWARNVATQSDLAAVLAAMEQEEDPVARKRFAICMYEAKYMHAIPCLKAWALGNKKELRTTALFALAKFPPNLELRRFAQTWLATRPLEHLILRIFTNNHRAGDATMLMEHVHNARGDRFAKYWFYSDLVDVYERDPADATMLLPFIYEEAPCAFTRFRAVQAMKRDGKLTPDIANECRDDSFADTRQLAASP